MTCQKSAYEAVRSQVGGARHYIKCLPLRLHSIDQQLLQAWAADLADRLVLASNARAAQDEPEITDVLAACAGRFSSNRQENATGNRQENTRSQPVHKPIQASSTPQPGY